MRKLITETDEYKENIRSTLGMNVDKFTHEDSDTHEAINFVCWDIGGRIHFRDSLWTNYIHGSMGICWVVDSSDPDRFQESKTELWKYIFTNPELTSNLPILILANKQDSEGAVSAGAIGRSLKLSKVTTHSYFITPVSAKTGHNLDYALDWMTYRIAHMIKSL